MTAAKTRVAVLGTVGKSVQIDPRATEGSTFGTDFKLADGSIATVESLRALLGIDGGTLRHKNLLGLKQGDDHPQYTAWAQEESIRAPWEWKIGSAQQWHINDERVSQNVPLIINTNDAAADDPTIALSILDKVAGGGVDVQIINDTSVDTRNQFGFWEVTGRPPFSAGTGFRWAHVGDAEDRGELRFYSHDESLAGTEIYRHLRYSAQMLFAAGTAAAPTISIIDDINTGIFSAIPDTLQFSTGGTERLSISTTYFAGTLPWRGPDGSAGAPTFSFNADTNTGLFRASADQLGFSAGGTNRLTLSTTSLTSTLPVQVASGSAGSPTFAFSGDPNTGVFSNGADDLGFSAGGTLRLNISTTQVVSTLPIRGANGSNSAPTYSFANDSDSGMYLSSAGVLGFATGGTLRFGLGGAGELLDASGSAGTEGQVPTSAGSGAAWVWGEGGGGGGGGGNSSLVYVNTEVPAGNTVSNTVTETAFDSSYTIPEMALAEGSVLRMRLWGVYGTDASAAPTLRVRVKLDSTTIVDTTAVTTSTGASGNGWYLDMQSVITADGESGEIDSQAVLELSQTATTAALTNVPNTSTASIDTTGELPLTVTIEWGTADSDNTITLRQMAVWIDDAAVAPDGAAPATATYLTEDDETDALPNSRQLLAGTGISFDDDTVGQRTISVSNSGARVTRAATQTFTSGSDTAVSFSTEAKDDDSYWSAGSPTRFTISKDGWYVLGGRINWSTASQAGRRILGFRVDGTTPLCDAAQMPISTVGTGTRMSVSTPAYLTSGQYVELVARQDSGGNLDIESPDGGTTPAASMTIVKVG